MKPAIEWDVGDIDRLVNAAIQERVDLEYKSSAALKNTPGNKKEMSKDVSAMANASGGLIVYGVLEDKNHCPTNRDEGVDPKITSKEWIEDLLWSNITPKIDGVVIHPIHFSSPPLRVGYLIEVPQAMKAAPHQANDCRYYRRMMSKVAPMQDYEVRDLFRRSLAYAEIYGIAFELIVEGRRIGSLSREYMSAFRLHWTCMAREIHPSYFRRVAVIWASNYPIPPDMMLMAADMILAVDVYNAIMHSTQPGSDEVNINSEIKAGCSR